MGCDSAVFIFTLIFLGFQSTHPHGVRPRGFNRNKCYLVVSIHAPAWGATLSGLRIRTSILCFNPRTRMGCDSFAVGYYVVTTVSIHAPAWGATNLIAYTTTKYRVSIHAPA